jgi:hypothetical protein
MIKAIEIEEVNEKTQQPLLTYLQKRTSRRIKLPEFDYS